MGKDGGDIEADRQKILRSWTVNLSVPSLMLPIAFSLQKEGTTRFRGGGDTMTRYLSFRYLISIDFFEIQAISEYCNFSELLIYFGLSVV